MSLNSIFPTYLQIKLLYEQRFKPLIGRILDIDRGECKLKLADTTNEDTIDTLANNNKSEDGFDGFEDFSYDSNDFKETTKLEQEQYLPNQSAGAPQLKNKKNPKQKTRKTRTTITKFRLEEMNRIFREFQAEKDKGKNPTLNLKQIGARLGLGYSTILHKYREFRQNKEVKGGALLQSLQKKRKYGKSRDVQRYIERSLRERPFYTAVELSKFIRRKFGKQYTRSIISRHLTEMGYSFNNIKPFPIEKNASKYVQARRMFANIVDNYIQDDSNFIFIDEVAFSKNLFARCSTNFSSSAEEKKANEKESDYVSLIVAANSQRIHYYEIKNGYMRKEDFRNAIAKTREVLDHDRRYTLEPLKQYILLTDIHRIHRDEEAFKSTNEESIAQCLMEAKMKRLFLPPGSPQLNPLQSFFSTVRERLNKEGITDQGSLRQKLQILMKGTAREPTCVYFKELGMWIQKAKSGENF